MKTFLSFITLILILMTSYNTYADNDVDGEFGILLFDSDDKKENRDGSVTIYNPYMRIKKEDQIHYVQNPTEFETEKKCQKSIFNLFSCKEEPVQEYFELLCTTENAKAACNYFGYTHLGKGSDCTISFNNRFIKLNKDGTPKNIFKDYDSDYISYIVCYNENEFKPYIEINGQPLN